MMAELTIDEIIEDAMMVFGFGPEVLMCVEPDGHFCDMEPDELELARGTIVYLSFRLLLMERMKHGEASGGPSGWVAARRFQFEIWEETSRVLCARGTESERIDEMKRLYSVSSDVQNEDETYREKVDSVMQDFEERYGLDPESLGILFI